MVAALFKMLFQISLFPSIVNITIAMTDAILMEDCNAVLHLVMSTSRDLDLNPSYAICTIY